MKCEKDLVPKADEPSKSAWAFTQFDNPSLEGLFPAKAGCSPFALLARFSQTWLSKEEPANAASEQLQAVALYVFREHKGNCPRRSEIEMVSLRRDIIADLVSNSPNEHICEGYDHTHRDLAVKDEGARTDAVRKLLSSNGFHLSKLGRSGVALALEKLVSLGVLRDKYRSTALAIIRDAQPT